MGDAYQHVTIAQRFAFPAALYNALVDMAIHYRRNRLNGGPLGSAALGADATVYNNTGGDLARFAVVGLGDILISPTENADEFKASPGWNAETPATADHQGKIVILQEPIASGKHGLARVSGISVVQVNMTDADHGYAQLTNGDATKLTSHATAGHRILYAESGTGTKWAVVTLAWFGGALPLAIQVADTDPSLLGNILVSVSEGAATWDNNGGYHYPVVDLGNGCPKDDDVYPCIGFDGTNYVIATSYARLKSAEA